MTIKEVKEQLQEDILSTLEGFGVDEAMEGSDYNSLVSTLCDIVISNINKLKQ
jgi:hypothetical protein